MASAMVCYLALPGREMHRTPSSQNHNHAANLHIPIRHEKLIRAANLPDIILSSVPCVSPMSVVSLKVNEPLIGIGTVKKAESDH